MFGLELRELLMVAGGVLLGLVLVIFTLKSVVVGRKKKGRVKKQASLAEPLADYPDAPPLKKGAARVLVEGVEARLRLVVIVPTGAQQERVDVEDVPDLLNSILRGLGGCIASDKARVRVWPPQLSVKGFAPTFFRLVESPDEEGEDSRWIRLAGLCKARGKPFLLGLALYTDDATDVGSIALEPNEWMYRLKVEK